VDHDINEIRIVKRRGGAVIGRVIESPIRTLMVGLVSLHPRWAQFIGIIASPYPSPSYLKTSSCYRVG